MRAARAFSRVVWLVFPLLALALPGLAQTNFNIKDYPNTQAPPQVDTALRARVTEFMQYHVDGKFMKAFDLVAEDTKEEYFASGKMTLKSFRIDRILYSDDYQRAHVDSTVKRIWRIQHYDNEVQVPMATAWKIENGKWVWYNDQRAANNWLTPMGPSDVDILTRNRDGSLNMPKEITAEKIAAAASQILQQTGIDRQDVTFVPGKEATEKIVFHNGAQGSVQLQLVDVPSVPGLEVQLDKSDVNMGENAVLSLKWQPQGTEVPTAQHFRLMVVPFYSSTDIRISFGQPAPAAK